MTCEICGNIGKGRMISGIQMCEECFRKLSKLRDSNKEMIYYFKNSENLKNATDKAKDYLNDVIDRKLVELGVTYEQLLDEENMLIAEEHRLMAEEHSKQSYALNTVGLYEYDVVTILNKEHGLVDKEQMNKILQAHAADGWRLHTIYSNELGKNAISLLGLGTNSTACEDVLIFERKLKNDNA